VLLEFTQLLGRRAARVDGPQPSLLRGNELAELLAALAPRAISLEIRERSVLGQPALRAELLDDHCKRLAEFAIALDVQTLVDELVKQQAHDVLIAAGDHRAQH